MQLLPNLEMLRHVPQEGVLSLLGSEGVCDSSEEFYVTVLEFALTSDPRCYLTADSQSVNPNRRTNTRALGV